MEPVTLSPFQKNLAAVLDKEERVGMVNGKEETITLPTINSVVSSLLKSIFMVLDFLFRENCRSATCGKASYTYSCISFL